MAYATEFVPYKTLVKVWNLLRETEAIFVQIGNIFQSTFMKGIYGPFKFTELSMSTTSLQQLSTYVKKDWQHTSNNKNNS